MPQKVILKCIQCEKNESIMWRSIDNGQLCNECYEHNRDNLKCELEPDSVATENNVDDKKLRKSTRATRFKSKNTNSGAKTIPKGRSRRYIFKKMPFKTPTIVATTQTCDNLFYKVPLCNFLI